MWLLLDIFGGAFLYGITRPRHDTHNTYVEITWTWTVMAAAAAALIMKTATAELGMTKAIGGPGSRSLCLRGKAGALHRPARRRLIVTPDGSFRRTGSCERPSETRSSTLRPDARDRSSEPPAKIAFDGIVAALVGELSGPGNTKRGVWSNGEVEARFGDKRIACNR